MSWNDQDPWKKKQDGPPNIDNIIKNFFNSKSEKPNNGDPVGFSGVLSIVLALFALYVVTGFYIVKQPENAVVTRFGKLHAVQGPGLKWHARFIDSYSMVNLDEILYFKKESQMLTRDENIVYIGVAIQYRRSDPVKFLFADQDPELTIENVAESSIRQAIGQSRLDDILTSGKTEINAFIKNDIISTLQNYDIGLELGDVNLTTVVPPKAVMEFFNDVTKAKEDKFSTINEAERYRESEIPMIQGQAEKVRASARAYKEEKILEAQGETAKFDLLLKEYRVDPEVFKRKIYFDTIESVLSQTTKVLIDGNAGQQLLYLPFDQMMNAQPTAREENSSSYENYISASQNDSEKASAQMKERSRRLNLTAPAFNR